MLRALPFMCFFLSGAAGLVAEVCWIRQATLLFGSTTSATSSVVGVFFLGLAAGSWIFGQVSRRSTRPLLLYAGLECSIAALVVASPLAFGIAESWYGHFYRAAGGAVSGLARVVLAGTVVLPPALLMGGTLPLYCRQFVRHRHRIAGGVGLLYGLNTLGAATGCALAGFVLLPAWGLRRTLLVSALLGLMAGVGALLSRRPPLSKAVSTPVPTDVAPRLARVAGSHRAILPLYFCTGFVALGNEVLWTRFLGLVVRTTVHTYTLSLTVVLVGIVLGSGLASAFADRIESRARVFGGLQVLGGLVLLATLYLPPAAWRILGSETRTSAVLALLPAMLSGASFPLAVRMLVDHPAFAGRAAGWLTAANTLGGIAGALCIGFLALPYFGLAHSLRFTTGLACATGFVTWWVLAPDMRRGRGGLAVVAALAAWLAIPRLLPTRLPADFLGARHELVDFREGQESNLAVLRRQRTLQLEADRWWQGQGSKTHQILAAHVPMLLHRRPERVLVVGVGAGQTPQRFLLYDIVRLDCIDIEPAVFDIVRQHFDSRWMDDPRVRLLREDGRNYISHTAERYDVIGLEVGQIFRPGVEAFYTTDFYRRARARLSPDGLLSQFVPLAFLEPETFASLVASFVEVFPQSVLWYNTSELLLIGAQGGNLRLDPARLGLLSADAGIHADLLWSHWGGVRHALHHETVFLGGFLCGPAGLAALADGAPLLRDDRFVLARRAQHVTAQEARELPILDRLRSRLGSLSTISNAAWPDSTLAAAAAMRNRNLDDIVASALLRRVDPLRDAGRHEELEALLRRALAANTDNLQANRLLADLLLVRGRAPEAAQYYGIAIDLAPDDAAANFGMALLLHGARRFDRALSHYERGLARDPSDAVARFNCAAALVELGDLDGAERHLEAAVQLRPDYDAAAQQLARIRQFQSHTAPTPGTSPGR